MTSEDSNIPIDPKLVIVPTPIGNLGDMTVRSIDALKNADFIFSEDTRVTQKLLSALGITEHGALKRLDDNVMAEHASEVVSLVEDGNTVAYCSDAGMPGVSDPGAYLIGLFHDRGLPVEVLPGASAAVLAYVASAPKSPQFYFGAFLPRKDQQKRSLLESLKALDATLVFYESPKRLAKSLDSIASVFPFRDVTVCRELTKLHEEVAFGNSRDIATRFSQREAEGAIKGECAIVIESAQKPELNQNAERLEEGAMDAARKMVQEGVGAKTATATLVQDFGINKNRAYELFLSARKPADE